MRLLVAMTVGIVGTVGTDKFLVDTASGLLQLRKRERGMFSISRALTSGPRSVKW